MISKPALLSLEERRSLAEQHQKKILMDRCWECGRSWPCMHARWAATCALLENELKNERALANDYRAELEQTKALLRRTES